MVGEVILGLTEIVSHALKSMDFGRRGGGINVYCIYRFKHDVGRNGS
jgi:hypothetical protein